MVKRKSKKKVNLNQLYIGIAIITIGIVFGWGANNKTLLYYVGSIIVTGLGGLLFLDSLFRRSRH